MERVMLRESRQVDGGKRAPPFSLPDTEGRVRTLSEFDDAPALLVAFFCNHCPFVLHIVDEFAAFARDYAPRGLQVVAISSNDTAEFPEDGPEHMGPFASAHGFTFPLPVRRRSAGRARV
jgi:peroxiredoxin